MEKQRYQVFRTLVYHYRDGVVTESQKSLHLGGFRKERNPQHALPRAA